MAAASRCPRGQQRDLCTRPYPGPNRQPSVLVGHPFLLFPKPPDKGKDPTPSSPGQGNKKRRGLRPRRPRAALPFIPRARPHPSILRQPPPYPHTADPRVPQKGQYRLRRLFLPQPFTRGRSGVLPLLGLPYILPQPSNLRPPSPALREQMVASLPPPPTPPAPVVVCPVDPVLQVGPDRRMAE